MTTSDCKFVDIDKLSTTNIRKLGEEIKEGKNIVFITGAGLSVASGIRAYRSTPDAMWAQRTMDWCTLAKFRKNPLEWWTNFWLPEYMNTAMLTAKPSTGHLALAKILALYPNTFVVTQNVDGLHSQAAPAPALGEKKVAVRRGERKTKAPKRKFTEAKEPTPRDDKDVEGGKNRIVEAHGNLHQYRCSSLLSKTGTCLYVSKKCFELDEKLFMVPMTTCPVCPSCDAPAYPAVLLFDQDYTCHDVFNWTTVEEWLDEADSIVFVGSSNSVGLTEIANRMIKRSGGMKTCYHFNLGKDANASDYDRYVLGKCELTLPLLINLL